jgi:hypothetical protein
MVRLMQCLEVVETVKTTLFSRRTKAVEAEHDLPQVGSCAVGFRLGKQTAVQVIIFSKGPALHRLSLEVSHQLGRVPGKEARSNDERV